MNILVTGGAGYIGSHTCVELLDNGFDVQVLDNMSNSHEESLRRVQTITGKPLKLIRADLRDLDGVREAFRRQAFDAVIHFAGLKAVGESTEIPLDYYENNVGGTLNLCRAMDEVGLRKLVFSSSATVYGDPSSLPIDETFSLSATNPYGRSKLMIEEILRDIQEADSRWHVILLRYFNPVGAHGSGLIGEDPNGIPNNLMPFISQVAVGKLPELRIFGNDYSTPDGTGVRDYIHVVDLAGGHVKALQRFDQPSGTDVYNLGTGRGHSVLEIVHTFERENGVKVPYRVVERRAGDIAMCYADPSRAERDLGWSARLSIEDMVRDTWRWQSANPSGYVVQASSLLPE
jgi:UDP-glucose 4-epimerase